MASIQKRPDGHWRARYRDADGKEHARHFARKVDGQRWLDEITTAVGTGTYVDPKTARLTVGEWLDLWLEGYSNRAPGTLRQARVHAAHIRAEFGGQRLADVRPSAVRAWTAKLSDAGLADSTVHAIYRRFAQVMSDAVHDGVVPRSPCSRRTSPRAGGQRPYVATTAQVWQLHDAVPDHLRPAVLLGAFAGLRVSEAVSLRVVEVDFMRGVLTVTGKGGKTARVAIAGDLALRLSGFVQRYGGETLVTDEIGRPVGPWAIDRAVRVARESIDGLPDVFRFHDLRHHFASVLIAGGCSVKVVQAQMRHASATTTLNVYGHLMPDADETSRAAIEQAMAARADYLRTVEVSG